MPRITDMPRFNFNINDLLQEYQGNVQIGTNGNTYHNGNPQTGIYDNITYTNYCDYNINDRYYIDDSGWKLSGNSINFNGTITKSTITSLTKVINRLLCGVSTEGVFEIANFSLRDATTIVNNHKVKLGSTGRLKYFKDSQEVGEYLYKDFEQSSWSAAIIAKKVRKR